MAIPRNITREHVLRALREIDERRRKGEPDRESRKWFLLHNGKRYPPKHAISLANKYCLLYTSPSPRD